MVLPGGLILVVCGQQWEMAGDMVNAKPEAVEAIRAVLMPVVPLSAECQGGVTAAVEAMNAKEHAGTVEAMNAKEHAGTVEAMSKVCFV